LRYWISNKREPLHLLATAFLLLPCAWLHSDSLLGVGGFFIALFHLDSYGFASRCLRLMGTISSFFEPSLKRFLSLNGLPLSLPISTAGQRWTPALPVCLFEPSQAKDAGPCALRAPCLYIGRGQAVSLQYACGQTILMWFAGGQFVPL